MSSVEDTTKETTTGTNFENGTELEISKNKVRARIFEAAHEKAIDSITELVELDDILTTNTGEECGVLEEDDTLRAVKLVERAKDAVSDLALHLDTCRKRATLHKEQKPLDPNSLEGKRHALGLKIESERKCSSLAWNALAWIENRTQESNDSVHSQADTIRSITFLARRHDHTADELFKELQKLDEEKIPTIRTVADVAVIVGAEIEQVEVAIKTLEIGNSIEYAKYQHSLVSHSYTCDEKTKAETWELSVVDAGGEVIAKGKVTISDEILRIRTVADVAAILGTDDKEEVRIIISNLAPHFQSGTYKKYGRRIVSHRYTQDEKTKAETWELSVIDADNRILAKGEVTLPEKTPTLPTPDIKTIKDIAKLVGISKDEAKHILKNLKGNEITRVLGTRKRKIFVETYTINETKETERWRVSIVDEEGFPVAKGEVILPTEIESLVSFEPISDTSGLSTLARITKDLETLYKSNPEDKERIEYIIGEAKPILVEACKILSASSPDIHKKRLEGKVRECFAQESISDETQHKLEGILRICEKSKSESIYLDLLKKCIGECEAQKEHARMNADGLSRVLHL